MAKQSKIAEIGMMNILNQMKNPLTNIRLCIEAMEEGKDGPGMGDYREIIKSSAIKLEDSIRDLYNSFTELGATIHIERDTTPLQGHH